MPGDVWRGTALQVLGRFWGAGCTFVILLLAMRGNDAAGFGRFTFYLAMFAWLDALATMGTGQVAIQRTAAHPEQTSSVLAAGRRLRIAAGLFGVALTAAIAFGSGEKDALWIVVAALYPVTHAFELSATVFRNRLAWGVPVRMRAIASGLSLLFVAILASVDCARPALYLLAVALGSASANFLLHRAAVPLLPRSEGAAVREPGMLRESVILGLQALCAQTYFYIDNLFVEHFRGDADLGHYNVAVRVMSWSIMLAQYTSLSVLPWLRRRHVAGELGPATVKLVPPLFAFAGLACGLVWPWSSQLLALFDRIAHDSHASAASFGAAGPALKWLWCATVAIYAGALLLTSVVALGNRNQSMLWIAACAVVLNIAANTWAVPAMGIEGAGLTTFATEAFVAIAAAAVLARAGVKLGPAWPWLGGPVLFALGAWLSSLLPLG